jgi:hypothetical protein
VKKGKGFTPTNQNSKGAGLAGTIYHNQGKGYASGGSVQGGSGSGKGRLRKSRAAARIPAKTEL